jgi:hypothetical protein
MLEQKRSVINHAHASGREGEGDKKCLICAEKGLIASRPLMEGGNNNNTITIIKVESQSHLLLE